MKSDNINSENELSQIIASAMADELDDDAIAELALRLASSGDTIAFQTNSCADIASTGGPSSLSTLLCPLYLRVHGKIVPKLGIPGRPAGGLDILGMIPGYRTELSTDEIQQILSVCGYAHFAAGYSFVPVDLQLFRLRQGLGAQAVPSLVIASLLSKKIASGVRTVGLDVRVAAHANFGSDFFSARKNASRFCRIARILGMRATCILTDAELPYQPYVGRGEALMALSEIFSGTQSPWLERHLKDCALMASAVTGVQVVESIKNIERVFHDNLEAQGSSSVDFAKIVQEIKEIDRIDITTDISGFVHYDLHTIRNLLVQEQKKLSGFHYPDPAGVILRAEPSQFINKGERVISLRAPDQVKQELSEHMAKCFSISKVPSQASRSMEVVIG